MSQTTPDAGPVMSTPETLTAIFFEPAAAFEALRARPRFLVAGLTLVALALAVTVLVLQKVNYEEVVRRAMETNPRTEQMTPEQKEQAVAMQTGSVGKAIAYGAPVFGTAIIIAAGSALYLLGASLMGGRLSYKQALSVWTYSSFPPAVLGSLLAVVLLFLKSADDLDFSRPGAGLVVTNIGALLGEGTSPALRAALSWVDLFTFYGMFLAALGLRKVGKLSSGSAWAIVIALWFLGMLFAVGRAVIFGG
ncbi:MAG TPA: YIP1 family protein [Pyrinomonadaceae bacterium]|nr:YIP1 family protein [Pyrinomonadaceae bacterium]